jgi:hypothetical protein
MASSHQASNSFDREAFSDLTIKCGDREFKTHKVYLYRASPYFQKLLDPNSAFREANQSVIELKEDEPDAVRAMLDHVNDLPYDGSFSLNDLPTSVRFHLKVFVTAKKYLLPQLQTQAYNRFRTDVGTLCGNRLPICIDQLIDLLEFFQQYIDEDEIIVQWIETLALTHLTRLIIEKAFRDWLEGSPILQPVIERLQSDFEEGQSVVVCNVCSNVYMKPRLLCGDCRIHGDIRPGRIKVDLI